MVPATSPSSPTISTSSANCGAAASQTFSYDPFGNINKAGSPAIFNAAYDSATNHITTVGGFSATYDTNGNVTADGLHTYSWDAEGNSIVQDTVNLTFDALGRMVEQARGASYTQIVYAPSGAKLALMSGQTLSKAFVPLPGGGTAVYTSSGLAYYRHTDWLGSSRFASTPTRTMYSDVAYAPFGETYAQAGTADPNFTGMNSDTSGSSYDFLFRQYGTRAAGPLPTPPASPPSILPTPNPGTATPTCSTTRWLLWTRSASSPSSSASLGVYLTRESIWVPAWIALCMISALGNIPSH